MKAEILNYKPAPSSSDPAPSNWRNIPEIKAAYPKEKNCEVTLQVLDGTNIAVWMIRKAVYWYPVGDYFSVTDS